MYNLTKEQALTKTREILDLAKPIRDRDDFLKEVAQKYGGEVVHTGGGVMVTIIQIAPHYVVGVSDDCVCLYANEHTEDKYYIFFGRNEQEVSFNYDDPPATKKRTVQLHQSEIDVEGHKFTVTHIPTATSGMWFIIHDVCEVWAAVAIDLDGSVVGWRNPPDEKWQAPIEQAIRKAFDLPEPEPESAEEVNEA